MVQSSIKMKYMQFWEQWRNGIGIRTAQLRTHRVVGQIHVYDGAGKSK